MDSPGMPAGDLSDYIDPAVIDAHIAELEAKRAAEEAGTFDGEDGPAPQDELSEDEEFGYGPGSYFARAMDKDD